MDEITIKDITRVNTNIKIDWEYKGKEYSHLFSKGTPMQEITDTIGNFAATLDETELKFKEVDDQIADLLEQKGKMESHAYDVKAAVVFAREDIQVTPPTPEPAEPAPEEPAPGNTESGSTTENVG